MDLREGLSSVLALQARYTSKNNADMELRGHLIRDVIPDRLAELRTSLAEAADLEASDLSIQGKDGVGRKSEVPWVRFASKEKSPSATVGWYVVWLFRRDGAGVYLALAHGSTTFNGGSLIARSDEDLSTLMKWSRASLGPGLLANPGLVSRVHLGSTGALALAYEKSCVTAFYYPAQSLPNELDLARDALTMAGLLGRLYGAEKFGQTPLSPSPEVRDAETAVTEIARPNAALPGQGFALTGPERKAVELHAMKLAIEHLESLGHTVKDVSASESFDLLAKNNGVELKVEVKGTTGGLGAILLTSNEVELHKQASPANALIVVHSIILSDLYGMPHASEGKLRLWMPWVIDERRLRSITFSYQLDEI